MIIEIKKGHWVDLGHVSEWVKHYQGKDGKISMSKSEHTAKFFVRLYFPCMLGDGDQLYASSDQFDTEAEADALIQKIIRLKSGPFGVIDNFTLAS